MPDLKAIVTSGSCCMLLLTSSANADRVGASQEARMARTNGSIVHRRPRGALLTREDRNRGSAAGGGATVGAIVGSIVGGPLGAAVGGAIGAFIGVGIHEQTRTRGSE